MSQPLATTIDAPLVASFHRFSRLAGLFSVAVGCVVLIGWALNIAVLKSIVPGWATMKANTALCFALAGMALWLLQADCPDQIQRTKCHFAKFCALFVLAIGLLTLIEYIFGLELGIDHLLFRDAQAVPAGTPIDRMSLATAFNFALVGAVLLLLCFGRNLRLTQSLAFLSSLVGLTALIGYIYSVQDLYRVLPFASMALHSALTFVVLAVGILCARPAEGWMTLFSGNGVGSAMARHLLPAAVFVPLFFGWLRLKGQQFGHYGTEFGLALFATSNILVFSILIWRTAISLNQTSQALQESEELFSEAFRLSMDYVSIVRARDRKLVRVNEALADWMGQTPEYFIGKESSEFATWVNDDERLAFMTRLQKDGKFLNYEAQLRLKTGHLVMLNISGRIVTLNNETCILGVMRDITQVTEQRKVIEEQQRFFTLALDLLCVFDYEGIFRHVNPAIETILGFTPQEVIGKSAFDYIHPDDIAPSQQALGEVINGGSLSNYVCRYRCRDGSYRSISWVTTPHVDSFYAAGRDITDFVQAQQEVQRTVEELKRSNAQLQQFTYVSSHDLQEPLRSIAGVVQILQHRYEDQLDARAHQLIKHAVDNVVRMQTLIEDLLTYSRVGTRGAPLVSTDCNSAVQQALANVDAAIRESGAQITVEPLPTVMADPNQMTQLFQNLLSNALKFRGAQTPEIHITARREGPEWQFAVCDNGIGIAPEYFDRIFVIFQRLHTRTEYPGTGIGLAICQNIIERHGGRIWVESQPMQGATFYFTIPFQDTIQTEEIQNATHK